MWFKAGAAFSPNKSISRIGDKDIISKDIFKRLALDIARILLHLQVDSAEILDTEYQRVEDRRADLVALVLVIQCDFKQRPAGEVVYFILQRLYQLTADNESRLRGYLRMLEVLSTNRDLEHIIKEKLKMLTQVKYSQLPSCHLGWEEGEVEGEIKGETSLLRRLLTRRFGPLDADTQTRLSQATREQLELWADNILDAATLEEVFKLN